MALDLYGDALQTLDEQTPVPAPVTPPSSPADQGPSNEFLDTLDRLTNQHTQRMRDAQTKAAATTPDRAAEVQRLSDVTGLMPDVVDRHFDDLSRRHKVESVPYDAIQRETPHLATFLADPQNAAVAHDDTSPGGQAMDHLGNLEWVVTAFQRSIIQANAEQDYAGFRTRLLMGDTLTPAEHQHMETASVARTAGGDLGVKSWFGGAVTGAGKMLQFLSSAAPAALVGMAGGAAVGGVLGIPGGPAGIGAGIYGGGTVGFEAGSAVGLAKTAFESSAGPAYDRNLALTDVTGRPLDVDVARAAAITEGAINGALMGKLPGSQKLLALLQTIPGVEKLKGAVLASAMTQALKQPSIVSALGQMMRGYGGNLAHGTVLMVAQDAVSILGGELAKEASGQSFVHITPSEAGAQLGQSASHALQSLLVISAVQPGLALAHDAQRAIRAQQAPAFFTALGEGVSQSKTVQRLPQAAQDFLARATKDGPVETVYAPVDTWAQHWQAAGVDPAEIATRVTGNPTAYADAVRTGADLAIPTARYATILAATEHNGFFVNELKLGPDEMNGRESAAWLAEQQAKAAEPQTREIRDPAWVAWQKVGDDAAAAHLAAHPDASTVELNRVSQDAQGPQPPGRGYIDVPIEPAPLTAVDLAHQALIDTQTQAGTAPDVADANASLVRAAFGTLSDRAGVDPLAQYQESGIAVRRPEAAPAAPAPAGEAIVDPAITRAIGTPDPLAPSLGAVDVPSADVSGADGPAASALLPSGTKDRLAALGLSLDAIDRMTPAEADTALSASTRTDQTPIPGARPMSEYTADDLARAKTIEAAMHGAGRMEAPAGRPESALGAAIVESMNAAGTPDEFFQSARVDPATKTPAFKDWFGESQAVTEKGTPIVVYHGSNRSFDTFELKAAMRNEDGHPTETTPAAFFFAEDKAPALMFANDRASIDEQLRGLDRGKPNVQPFYLSVQNPLDFRITSEVREQMNADGYNTGYNLNAPSPYAMEVLHDILGHETEGFWSDIHRALDDPSVIEGLKDAGYDGIRMTEDEGWDSWAVFDPEQIKSTKNAGAFDAADPNVFHQGGADAPRESVATLTGAELGEGLEDIKDLRAAAVDYYARELQHGIGSVERPGFGVVTFTRAGRDKFESSSADPRKLRLLPAVPDVIVRGAHDGPHALAKPRTDGIVAFHFFAAPVDLAGTTLTVIVSVGEDAKGNKFYNVNPDRDAQQIEAQRQERSGRNPQIQEGGAEPSEGGETTLKQSMKGGTSDVNLTILTPGDQPPRASIQIAADRRVTINLFKDADLSSFLHESGHLFLEVLGDLSDKVQALDPATHTPEQARLVADHQALLRAVGVESRGELTRAHHEQVADLFEQYLMEGRAPSVALQPAFARFRAWMLDVYKALRNLQVPLTDEVRGVFDRLLASDQAIADAEARRGQPAMFATAEDAGMTPERFALYRDTVEAAHATDVQRLDQQLLAEVRREQTAQYKAQRAATRDTVTAELQQQPIYRALAAMRDGTLRPGTAAEFADPRDAGHAPEPIRFSRDLLVERYGRERANAVPRTLVDRAGGFDPDLVAELVGYGSGDALLAAIREAPPIETAIAAETARRMQAAHGSALTDGTLPARADRALANDERAAVVRAELRALRARERDVRPFVRAGDAALKAEQQERAYERRWFEAETKLKVAQARGAAQSEIDALTAEVSRLKQQARSGAVTIRAGIPSDAVIQAAAVSRIDALSVRAIRPGEFWATSRRAAQQAIDRAARQDFAGAVTAKTQELVSLAHYRAAEAAQAAVEDALTAFKQLAKPDATIAKTRNLDLVQAARSVLASVGLATRPEGKVAAYLTSLKTYDPEAHAEILDLIEGATPAGSRDYRDLSFGTFRTMAMAVDALWTLARTTEQIEVAGEKQQLVDVRQRVLDQVHVFSAPREQVGMTRAVTGWDEFKVGLLGLRARMRRIEDWVTVMDNGREGPVRSAIFDPVNQGLVAFSGARVAEATRYAAEVVPFVDTETRHGKIAAPELGPGRTFADHNELLGTLLHTGNGYLPGSNGDKLLRGFKWGAVSDDGRVDTRQWDTFIARLQREGILTRAHYDYLQGVWDTFERLKPEAQAVMKARFGRYMDEVTAVPIETPWGTYRGGYYPAVADPFITPAVGERAEARALLEGGAGGSAMFPSVSRGMTQTRTEGYAAPLILDASAALQHVNAVLRFIHLSQPVSEVARLILHPSFKTELDAVDPAAVSELLVPYLQRAASQQMFTRAKGPAGRLLDASAREIRNRGSMQIIALNATVLAEQFTHFPSVLAHGDVDGTALLAGLWRLSREPKAMAADVHEVSPYMATRESAGLDEAHAAIDRILLDPNPAQRGGAWVADHATVLMRGIQSAMDTVTWQAVYNKVAAEPGATHDSAVLRADSAVRQALGSYRPSDRSAIEGGPQIVGLLNQFYGFFNTKLNMLGTEAMLTSRMGLRRGFGRAFAVYGLGFLIPAMLGEGIKNAMGGHSPIGQGDDEDAATAFARFWAVSQGKMAARMIPFVGPLAVEAITAFAGGKPGSVLNAPSIQMVVNAVTAPGHVYQALVDPTRTHAQNAKAITDFFTMLGLMSNLPLRPVGQAVNVVHDYASGPQ